ncbi:hypothetical protein K2X33_14085 [bacterium]|nr:hypothetical protein [bacterium]
MNSQSVRWLQWVYPLVLWFAVAFFTVLACKNTFAQNWEPNQPARIEAQPTTTVVAAVSQYSLNYAQAQ